MTILNKEDDNIIHVGHPDQLSPIKGIGQTYDLARKTLGTKAATEAKLQANRRGDILLANNFSFHFPYNDNDCYQCNVYLTQYPNGQNCIRLEDNIYGEPIAHATASVNLYANDIVHQKACDDHVVIKDYCENAGMLKRLQDAGIVGETVLHINGIHSGLHMCQLLQEPDL